MKLCDSLCLLLEYRNTHEFASVFLLLRWRLFQPGMLADYMRHMNFVALGLLRLILPVEHLAVVKLDFLDVAEVEMHLGEPLIGGHLDFL